MTKLTFAATSVLLVSAFWLGACSDDGDSTSAATSSAASTGSTGGSGGMSATGGAGGEDKNPTQGNCPDEPPTEGTPCDPEPTLGFGGSCYYGDHPNALYCRDHFVCEDGKWFRPTEGPPEAWCAEPIANCDGSKSDGDPCTNEPLCVDGDINCFCRDCYDNNGVTGPIWTCYPPPETPCPPVPAVMGSVCSIAGSIECTYKGWMQSGTYGHIHIMFCHNGFWDFGGSPVTTQVCDEK